MGRKASAVLERFYNHSDDDEEEEEEDEEAGDVLNTLTRGDPALSGERRWILEGWVLLAFDDEVVFFL